MSDIGTTIGTSLSNILFLLFATVPRIIGFLIIILVGWIIAGILAKLVATILRTIKFNEMTQRAHLASMVQSMGLKTDPSTLLAEIVKWFVRLIALVAAFDALGLPAVSSIVQQFLLFIPNLIVALIILVIAGLLANFVGDLVHNSAGRSGLGNPNMLATIARAAIWGFAIIAAVNQIGVASSLVNTLFTGFIGALTLAVGLAFGLGGRDTAAKIVDGWYNSARSATPPVETRTVVTPIPQQQQQRPGAQ